MLTFRLRFYFTSSKADGEGYTRDKLVKGKTKKEVLNQARIIGFQEFGCRFNDNCYDWLIVD